LRREEEAVTRCKPRDLCKVKRGVGTKRRTRSAAKRDRTARVRKDTRKNFGEKGKYPPTEHRKTGEFHRNRWREGIRVGQEKKRNDKEERRTPQGKPGRLVQSGTQGTTKTFAGACIQPSEVGGDLASISKEGFEM